MKHMLRFFVVPCFVVCSLPTSILAQKHNSSKLRDDIQLPADYSLDFQLGASARSTIRGSNALIARTPLSQAGMEVFHNLIASPSIVALARPYQWNFSVLDDNVLNAQSSPDGEIFVDGGLAQMIGTNRGLWAAVLSHETEHTAQRHWVKKYLYNLYVSQLIQYWQERASLGDKSANWVLLGLRISAPIAAAKLSRNLEHDADVKGMMLMAEVGYHPDYVFALHHMMLTKVRDQSHFAAFFSTHPRWETRDQRDDKAYVAALSEYNRRWPDPTLSPGGSPPEVVYVGKPGAREDKRSGTADLELPIYCRNTREPLSLVVRFSKGNQQIQSESGEYRDSTGNLEFRQQVTCTDKENASALDVHVPASLVSEKNRKTKAQVEVLSPVGEVLARFNSFEVDFPRVNGKSNSSTLASRTDTPTPTTSAPTRREITLPQNATTPPTQGTDPVTMTAVATPSANSLAPEPTVNKDRLQQPSAERGLESRAETQPNVEMIIRPGWIGVTTKDDATKGVVITRVLAGSTAEQAGLQVGDIMEKMDGVAVTSGMTFDVAVTRSRPGSQIRLTYMRGTLKSEVIVTVGKIVLSFSDLNESH
jgi:hypothetical protein